jgi:chemotaxis protein MotB
MGSKPPLLLMIVALVADCGTQQQYQQPPAQDEQVLYMNDTYATLNKSLEAEIKGDQVQVKQFKNRIQVTIADEILFPEGGWKVGPHVIEMLGKLSSSLQGLNGKLIVVQGFTDNLPVSAILRARFPTNWDLSAERATNVVRHLQTLGNRSLYAGGRGFWPIPSDSLKRNTRGKTEKSTYQYCDRSFRPLVKRMLNLATLEERICVLSFWS